MECTRKPIAPSHRAGGKIGIDATSKWPDEGHPREWPDVIRMDEEVAAAVKGRWGDLGLGL